jgi:hypothetical protein
MIQQLVIRMRELLQEQLSRTFQRIGFAQSVEWARKISSLQNK